MPRPAGVPLQLTAKEHLGEAPGGSSGAQLYRVVENADTYVVKFKGSAQGIRILFNEYVSGRLGELIDVPFGDHALVEVRDSLHPPNGTRNIAQRLPGTQFGTTFYENGQTDLQQLKRARNFTSHFPGVIVFDTFIDRGASRQYVVYPGPQSQNGERDTGIIFDQGHALTRAPACVSNDFLGLRPDLNRMANYAAIINAVE